MNHKLEMKVYAFTLDCPDPNELAKFYTELLAWVVEFADEDYVCIAAPGAKQGAYPGITFQRNPDYVPPVWPTKPQAQQQMAHFDFAVNDLEKSVEYAVQCGARVAEEQFSQEWTVMLDPAGHPFCLCQMQHVFTENE